MDKGIKREIEQKNRERAIFKFNRSIKKAKVKPNLNCKVEGCWGRGYIGRDTKTNLMRICKCLGRG